MFEVNKKYQAVHRLIDSVWTLEFTMTHDGVEVNSFSRDNPSGYQQENSLPKVKVLEDSKRNIISVQFYKPEHRFYMNSDDENNVIGEYAVTNPQSVFSYEYEVSHDD